MPFNVEFALKKLARYNGASGTVWDAPSNSKRLQQAREFIYEQGDFVGTVEWAHLRVNRGEKFRLPAHVECIRSAYRANGCPENVSVQNMAYNIIDHEISRSLVMRDGLHAMTLTVVDTDSRKPYYHCIPACPFFLFVTNESKDDNGVNLSFRVIKSGKERQQDIGLVGLKGAIGPEAVSDIIHITKPPTKGYVKLWAKYGTNKPTLLATYSPGSVDPLFREYAVGSSHENGHIDLVAFCKKKCLQLTEPRQVVDIESLNALIHAYKAINAQEGDDGAIEVQEIQLMEKYLSRSDRNLDANEPMMAMKNISYWNLGGADYDL